jgi:hypothetical protein
MEPEFSLIKSLIGNLSPSLHIGAKNTASPGASSKLKDSNQINQTIINIIAGQESTQTILTASDLNQRLDDVYKKGYHAVFLDNEQVYFVKLEVIDNKKFVKLTNVYYFSEEFLTDKQATFNLIKLGNELHRPDDLMNINVNHILFWEHLLDDGALVKAILNYETKQDAK